MKQYNIEYSKKAVQDLIDIKRYIKYILQEPEISKKLMSKIKIKIDNLKNDPKIYAIINDKSIQQLKIRKLLVDNYIIFYRIENTTIQIVRIMYGRRNWINLI